jgi:hypothetical protein
MIEAARSRDRAEPDDAFARLDFLRADTDGVLADGAIEAPLVHTQLRSAAFLGRATDLAKAQRRLNSPKDRRRTASLLVLLAHLEGLSFDEAAELLGTSSGQLQRWVRGEQTVPVKKFDQIERFAEVLRHLHRVLEPHATRRWLHTSIPALEGRTPYDEILRRRFDGLVALAHSYTEPNTYS